MRLVRCGRRRASKQARLAAVAILALLILAGAGLSAQAATGPTTIRDTEGATFSGVVAFYGSSSCSNPSATIAWGDGATTAAAIDQPSLGDISGTHTYSEEGSYDGQVSYTDDCGTSTFSFVAIVGDAALTATSMPITATAGTPFSGAVAALTDDAGPYAQIFNYTVSIDWGDGSTSPGTVSGTSSALVVDGTHTYATAGTYNVDVSIVDDGGSSTHAFDTANVSAAPVPGAPLATTGPPSVGGTTVAGLSGSVDPNGLATSAHFEFGLDPRYSGSTGPVVYDQSTPVQQVGSDFTTHAVSAALSGLLPNALYHVRLVASNSDGTTFGSDQTFTTKSDPPPRAPVLGHSVDIAPASGIVFINLPHGSSVMADSLTSSAPVVGNGFLPLTEPRPVPLGSKIDARLGTIKLAAAPAKPSGKHGHPQSGRHANAQTGKFSGGIFAIHQSRKGAGAGQATLSLLAGAFHGAPSFSRCARSAPSTKVVQTLLSQVTNGKFRIRGRYSTATARKANWVTTDRCDGTQTRVKKGTVDVFDFHRGKTVVVHAGSKYLARAVGRKKRK